MRSSDRRSPSRSSGRALNAVMVAPVTRGAEGFMALGATVGTAGPLVPELALPRGACTLNGVLADGISVKQPGAMVLLTVPTQSDAPRESAWDEGRDRGRR